MFVFVGLSMEIVWRGEKQRNGDKMPRGSDRDVEHVFMCLLAVRKFCADSVG